MRVTRRVVWCALAIMASAMPVFADAFTVLGVTRTISVEATAGNSTSSGGGSGRTFLDQTRMATAGDDFANVSAGLDTTDTFGNAFAAIGNTFLIRSSTAAEVGGAAVSTFAVDFLVNEPLRFIFGGTLSAFGMGSSWFTTLQSELGDVFRFEGRSALGPLANERLAPGRYRFLTQARSSVVPQVGTGQTGASFNVAFGLDTVPSPAPEPGSLLLLGIGLAGVIVRRRSRRS